MKIVNVHEAKTTLSALLSEVERGEDVVIARNGVPVARIIRAERPTTRDAGLLSASPAWREFRYDKAVFAPMTDADLADEGWP